MYESCGYTSMTKLLLRIEDTLFCIKTQFVESTV